MPWLKRWWPAIVWAIAISGFSTGAFTSENTSRFIIPVLRFLLPHASADTLAFWHHIIRKCAHFTEYFIFSLLVLRGFRAAEKGTRLRWALLTVLIVAGYASLDEFHQSFVPGRTPAVSDVLIDTIGGAAAQFAAWLWMLLGKSRGKRRHNELPAVETTSPGTH
jgi:VanZ family protein